ncbi:TetR/AcrR family transcriptional regulator [Hoyosella subflava]|uniref:TetR/AcrR family transcriptional regulator n=1 Tax=Hoyosella subflava TaxID=639313 RepID=UPI000674A17D|nr:TetR/AcrR family transcriptional regulator [Hoyosella subflava]
MAIQKRTYAGVPGADRSQQRRTQLIEAGLELMGSQGVAATTVRGVISQSGVSPKYFYEHFTSVDELQVAVFDAVIAEVEQLALAALASAPRNARSRIRAVLAAITDLLLTDPRKGRILLTEAITTPVLATRRLAEVTRFSGLLAHHSRTVWQGLAHYESTVLTTSHFAVGGYAETLAWVLEAGADVDRAQLVDELTELLLGTGDAFARIVRHQRGQSGSAPATADAGRT